MSWKAIAIALYLIGALNMFGFAYVGNVTISWKIITVSVLWPAIPGLALFALGEDLVRS